MRGLIENRVELPVILDLYEQERAVDPLSGEEYDGERLIAQDITLLHTIVISLDDEFRQGVNSKTGKIDPTTTIIDRSGSGTNQLIVKRTYEEVEAIYQKLATDTAAFILMFTKIENE